ncbi:GNAT family N-acetyltransferase [Nocardia sp. NPDC058176]|uniref:GNAT family N-acetyltransferase n=1 Tax=Nocardia sp. NPDC058176 TaxID=3346368 RepID=UPI0036DF17DE
MTTRLEHNVDDTRFEIYLDDVLAGYADYAERENPKVRDFHHTMTFPEFRGHGVAAKVVEFALQDSRTNDYRVIPTCWYVEKYIADHPEYANLVA